MVSSLRARLTVIAAGVALLVVGLTAGLASVISDLARTTHDLERLASRIALTERLQLELSRLLSPLNDYLLTEDVSRRDAFDQSVREIAGLLAELQHNQADAEWRAVAREIHNDVTHLGTLAVEVLFVEHPVGDRQVVRVMNTVNRLSEETVIKAARFHALSDAELTVKRQRAVAQSVRVDRLFLALALAVPIALVIGYRGITRWAMMPLGLLVQGVSVLASGRAARLMVRGHDQIAKVSSAVNELADRLVMAQEDAQRRSRHLEALYAAGHAFTQLGSREDVYRTLTAATRLATDAQCAVLAVVNDHEQVIQIIESGVSPFGQHTPEEWQAFIAALPSGHRPLRIDAGEQETRWQGLRPGGVTPTLMTVPVLVQAGTRSQLYLFDTGRTALSDAEEDLVVQITQDAAQALRLIGLREEAERIATVDSLTGFLNRWAFEERLADELLRAARHGRSFALVFIDVDHLKAINEKGGHPAGDAAIRRFSDAIRSVIRTTDVASRYGGDEMLVLLPDAPLKDAMAAATRILRRVASLPLSVKHERIALSASLGVAVFPEHGRDKESLLRAVDFALYQAKATGGGRVHAVKPTEGDTAAPSKVA